MPHAELNPDVLALIQRQADGYRRILAASRTAPSCTPAGEPEGAREQQPQSFEAGAEPAPTTL